MAWRWRELARGIPYLFGSVCKDELMHLRTEFLHKMRVSYPALEGKSTKPLGMWHMS